jgi:hypothetical protein
VAGRWLVSGCEVAGKIAGKRLGGRDLTNFKTESARIKQILSLRKSGN